MKSFSLKSLDEHSERFWYSNDILRLVRFTDIASSLLLLLSCCYTCAILSPFYCYHIVENGCKITWNCSAIELIINSVHKYPSTVWIIANYEEEFLIFMKLLKSKFYAICIQLSLKKHFLVGFVRFLKTLLIQNLLLKLCTGVLFALCIHLTSFSSSCNSSFMNF